jgi:hypothetical protein
VQKLPLIHYMLALKVQSYESPVTNRCSQHFGSSSIFALLSAFSESIVGTRGKTKFLL